MSSECSNEAGPAAALASAPPEGKPNPSETAIRSIGSEMERILRVAGIESAPMDPSSAKCLRELIAFELEKNKKESGDIHKRGEEGSTTTTTIHNATDQQPKNDDKPRAPNAMNPIIAPRSSTTMGIAATDRNNKKAPPKVSVLSKPLKPPSNSEATAKAPTPAKSTTGTRDTPVATNRWNNLRKFKASPNPVFSADTKPEITASSSSSSSSSFLTNQLLSQQKVLEDQSEALKLLTNNIQELTNTVQSLQQSVDRLQPSQYRMASTPGGVPPADYPPTFREPNTTENDPNEGRHASDDINNNNNNAQQENGNEFQRAHMLAHNVAWRIATFPVRAIFFYLRYEYRIWLVMYRLARRDVLNPFREAGMIFQLGFALIIVYGRLAPALENAVNERKRQQEQNDDGGGDTGSADDDDYYSDYYYQGEGEDILNDATFQIQSLVTAVIAGFLYHVGVFGLGYRFFFRDRLHVRIWNDLREGVELTPTYGLHFDPDNQPPAADANDNENNNNNENEHNVENNRNNNENNNNVPRPPNRNRNPPNGNRGNEHDDGPLIDMAHALGNGINDFFMGHGRRRRAAQGQAAAHEPAEAQPHRAFENGDDNGIHANPDHRNPILGLISDLVCLFYSFFVSILPGWNYEQQLRDIRDEDDRRLREIVEREAEALRNQNTEDDADDASSEVIIEFESESESDSSESDSEDGDNQAEAIRNQNTEDVADDASSEVNIYSESESDSEDFDNIYG